MTFRWSSAGLSKVESLEEVLRQKFAALPSAEKENRHVPLTVKEACDYLKMPAATFYYKVERGEIPAVKQGKRYYIYQDELERWLECGRRNPVPLTPDERIAIIEIAIYRTEGLGLVLIDGIRDLVYDINSPGEAICIISKLMQWTDERQIYLHTILHQNKGDENARGHIGTELNNKAETVILVEKDKNDKEIKSSRYTSAQ